MEHTPSAPRDEVRTFWVGPPLSHYEILSLKSFVAAGAKVFLYSDATDLAVPEGVELRSAAEILPDEMSAAHSAEGQVGRVRQSDLFRYAMMEKFGSWYADLDVICLQDRLPGTDTYFAADGDVSLNTAILKFPPASDFLRDLLAEARRVLATAPDTGTSFRDRKIIGAPLLKKYVDRHGLGHFGRPISAAYEIPSYDILSFFDPSRREEVQSRLAGRDFVHLWNEAWNLLRIPRRLGPPRGSFLETLFERFDVAFPDRARLEYEAIESWVREHRLVKDICDAVGSPAVTAKTIDEFAARVRLRGWRPAARDYAYLDFSESKPQELPSLPKTGDPQVVRTFWHGETIGPYQQLCLKSFADHGHTVEVFSYGAGQDFPDWLVARNAAEILPAGKVLVPMQQSGQIAIHADLLRYALLEKLGGWWIEPDVVLMQPDLPPGDIMFAGAPNVFGQVPTTVLRFPPRHPLMTKALADTVSLGETVDKWGGAGAALLTALLAGQGLRQNVAFESLGPVTWLSVPDLFDPAMTDELTGKCASTRFLHLQGDVWRRAGVPQVLAPPEGSLLDLLLSRHAIDHAFGGRMEFGQLNRWIRHMYRAANVQ
ncbi:MAG: hypothetical protein EKK40_15075 [Bradyrhizobiaceae bacterium]|nr:MAG: hypothetical protein EKK40_15075 [Bradyrhizobiaceae bacterium]